MIVDARKVNGLHGLFRFWSFKFMARLASCLSETRNLLVEFLNRY